MRKRIFTHLSLLVIILFSSCATLFGPKKQTLVINTEGANDSIFMYNQFMGTGSLTVRLNKKNTGTHSFQVKKKGYLDRNYVAIKTKRSTLAYLNLPFYLALYFGKIGDVVDFYYGKGINFDKNHFIPAPVKEPHKKADSEKYLNLENISFEISENDTATIYCFLKEFKKSSFKADGYTRKKDSEYMQFDYSTLNGTTKEFLIKYNYFDPENFLFSNYSNTLKISGVIKKILFYQVAPFQGFEDGYVIADITTEWTLKDFYGVEIKKYTITKRSDPIAKDNTNPDRPNNAIHPQVPIQNALNYSLTELLDSKEFRMSAEMTKEVITSTNEVIEIEKPAIPSASLNQLIKSVVTIKNRYGYGSGFIISPDGYVVTSLHVIAKGEKNLEVIMNDGTTIKAELIRKDQSHDLALLKINKTQLVSLQLSEISDTKIGSNLYAVGTPYNMELGQSVSKGIFSSYRKKDNINLMQIGIKVNSGNSGGPIINNQGQVIGIVTSKLVGEGVEGISFGTPSNYVFEQLHIKYK
jgi:serine protease Do